MWCFQIVAIECQEHEQLSKKYTPSPIQTPRVDPNKEKLDPAQYHALNTLGKYQQLVQQQVQAAKQLHDLFMNCIQKLGDPTAEAGDDSRQLAGQTAMMQ